MFRTKDSQKARSVKTGLDTNIANASRSKRQELTSRLRSRQQDEMLNRVRRNASAPVEDNSANAPMLTPAELAEYLASLPTLVHSLSDPSASQTDIDEGVTRIRRILSVTKDIPIAQVIEAGCLPIIIRGLESSVPDNVVNALWALTNITSGTSEETAAAVNAGAIDRCVPLLRSENMYVREQAFWMLCNIAGDSAVYRDILLSYGVLETVIANCHGTVRISELRTAVWFLSNLCRGVPAPEWDQIKSVVPTLFCMVNLQDDNTLADALWAIAAITDSATGTEELVAMRHRAIVDHGFLPRLILLLTHPNVSVKTPALRCVGNLTSGDDSTTTAIIQNNAIVPLQSLLTSQHRALRREALWTFSNITAGTEEQIHAVATGHVYPQIVTMLNDKNALIRKEAIWCVTNSIASGDRVIGEYLVSLGVLGGMATTLAEAETLEPRVLRIILESIEILLGHGAAKAAEDAAQGAVAVNDVADKLEELDVVDMVSELQNHSDAGVCSMATTIIGKYFCDPEGEQYNAEEPAVGEGGLFQFGAQAGSQEGGNQTFEF